MRPAGTVERRDAPRRPRRHGARHPGAVQHLAGIHATETIIAVNREPETPIFDVAHYGAVADRFEIIEQREARFAEVSGAAIPRHR